MLKAPSGTGLEMIRRDELDVMGHSVVTINSR